VPAPSAAAAEAPRSTESIASALDEARAALAEGDGALARRVLHRALASRPPVRARAAAELFLAESYLVERDPDRALAAYRKVAEAHPDLPEGEAAAFAAAQVLDEQPDSKEAARDALRAYLARYPEGRFAREAKERFAELPALP
jgi:TolA-binding protein